MDWNLTTTNSVELHLPTSVYTTFGTNNDLTISISETGLLPMHPLGTEQLYQRLTLKQILAVTAVVITTIFIILALLQIKIHKQCIPDFKKSQMQSANGKMLFILFVIGLLMFYLNSIIFTAFIFNFEDFPKHLDKYYLIFSMVPYRIGKLCMSLFFIFRLHFVFKDTALRINKWIIYGLSLLSFIATIIGCISAIGGPLNKVDEPIRYSTISLGITMFVDITVMIYYVQRLINVAVMQGRITQSTSMVCTSTGTKVTEVIELNKRIQNWSMDFDAEMDHNNIDQDEDEDEGIKKTTTIIEVKKTKVHVDTTMIGTATKSMLLSLIGIISSFWLHIEMIVLIARDQSDQVLFRAIASFDGAVNILCMYLIFAFAKPYYDIGCKFCHFGLEKLCKKFSKKAVIHRANSEKSEI